MADLGGEMRRKGSGRRKVAPMRIGAGVRETESTPSRVSGRREHPVVREGLELGRRSRAPLGCLLGRRGSITDGLTQEGRGDGCTRSIRKGKRNLKGSGKRAMPQLRTVGVWGDGASDERHRCRG